MAGRNRSALFSSAFYVVLVLTVQAFAFGAPEGRSSAATAGLSAGSLWTALLLASAVLANQSWQQEHEGGTLELLLAAPAPAWALYLGKLLGVAGPLLLVALPAAALAVGLFGAGGALGVFELLWLSAVVLAGVLGLSAACVFYGSLTARLGGKEALLPALVFPLLLPLAIACVRLSVDLLLGAPSDETWAWGGFLLVYDLITVLLSAALFRWLVEA